MKVKIIEATQQQHGNKLIADFDDRLENFPPTWIYQEGYRVRVGYSGYSFAGRRKHLSLMRFAIVS